MEISKNAQRVQNAIVEAGCDFKVVELPGSTRTAEDAANTIGCEVKQIVKSLIFQGKESSKAVLLLVRPAVLHSLLLLQALLPAVLRSLLSLQALLPALVLHIMVAASTQAVLNNPQSNWNASRMFGAGWPLQRF